MALEDFYRTAPATLQKALRNSPSAEVRAAINPVDLFYEITGSGEPMVLVHGSWGDHHNWAPVVPLLSKSFRVVTFDRRGHSQSQTGSGQGSFVEVVHEPPLIGLLEGKPEFEATVGGFYARVGAVVDLLRGGQMEAAARRFVETVAFGPGAWDNLPQAMRDTFIRNAPTFLDESNDPDGLTIDLSSLRAFERPSLVTTGTESPPFFKPITAAVAEALPCSTSHTFQGAGHVPHRAVSLSALSS
jgi:pimeloyl-ACP methyl ester carboxylesterase